MLLSPLRCAIAGLLLTTLAPANAAETPSVSLREQVEQADAYEVTHAAGKAAATSRVRVQQFANGDQLTTWDDGGVLLLCEKVGFIKVPADKPEVASLSQDQRKMLLFTSMMGSIGAVAMVMEAAGDTLAVPADGSAAQRTVESPWAYGVERSEITSQRLPDGALRVRSLKTENVTTTPASSPDDTFSTDEDRAARLAELTAVGSWTDVWIGAAPKPAQLDAAFSLKGWVSTDDARPATVGEARAAAGCAD